MDTDTVTYVQILPSLRVLRRDLFGGMEASGVSGSRLRFTVAGPVVRVRVLAEKINTLSAQMLVSQPAGGDRTPKPGVLLFR